LQFRITLGEARQFKIVGAPEALDQVLAQLAAFLVIDRQGDFLDVEGEGVAIEEHEDQGEQNDFQEADGVPADVDHLFAEDGPGAAQVHGLSLSAFSGQLYSCQLSAVSFLITRLTVIASSLPSRSLGTRAKVFH